MPPGRGARPTAPRARRAARPSRPAPPCPLPFFPRPLRPLPSKARRAPMRPPPCLLRARGRARGTWPRRSRRRRRRRRVGRARGPRDSTREGREGGKCASVVFHHHMWPFLCASVKKWWNCVDLCGRHANFKSTSQPAARHTLESPSIFGLHLVYNYAILYII